MTLTAWVRYSETTESSSNSSHFYSLSGTALIDPKPTGGRGGYGVAARNVNREVFLYHANKWHDETGHQSSLTKRKQHPSYAAMVNLGTKALPFILICLLDKPDFWFPLLRDITNEDPVEDFQRGDYNAMRRSWLEWGYKKGFVGNDVLSRVT